MFENVYRYGKIKKVNIETEYFADCPKGWRVENDLFCGKQNVGLGLFVMYFCSLVPPRFFLNKKFRCRRAMDGATRCVS